MITSLKFNNCFAFNKEVEMNLKADLRTKKFSSNVINVNEKLNILKSAVLYGPNNTGKTTFINCIKALKDTLLNKEIYLESNIFNDNNICEESVTFVNNNKEYLYEYKYDNINRIYIFEKMSEIIKDKYNNEKEELIFLKDTLNEKYQCTRDKELEKILNITSNNNILIYTLQVEKFPILEEIKNILTTFANNIEIVDMNKIPNSKTIQMLKNKNEETKKVVDFIKNADLYLDDYKYIEDLDVKINGKIADEKILKNQNLMDQIKVISVYKGKAVPSIIFDSLGTRKFAALASYVIEAIEKGKTLIIDELDSSLHFKITRAIISMFNNEINKNAQLIATLHDISLLDCKRMFRKEQIWFTDKDEEGTALYSLKEFSYAENGVRDTSDIQEKYTKGEFGAIPEPDLISTLLEVDDEEYKGKRICIICEGYEELDYIETLKRKAVFSNKDVKLTSQSKTVNSKYIKKYVGIENYKATDMQRKELFSKIKRKNYEKMKENISKLSTNDNITSSTNILKFLERFEKDDDSWINEINSKTLDRVFKDRPLIFRLFIMLQK